MKANEFPPPQEEYPSEPYEREEQEEEQEQEEEEYIEMDYASEIEECSHYIFSERPYCRNTTHAEEDEEMDVDWVLLRQQQQRQRRVEEERETDGGCAAPAYGHVALRALITEARRKHLSHLRRSGSSAAVVLEAKRHWRLLAHRTAEDLQLLGYERVRRSVAAMCLFNLENGLLFDDSSSNSNSSNSGVYARDIVRNKERLLQQLREQNTLFISTPTTPTVMEIQRGEEEEECTLPFFMSSVADVLPPLCVFPVPFLNPNLLEASSTELPLLGDGDGCLLDTSLESGGGASSSNNSSNCNNSSSNSSNNSDTDDCDSPKLSTDDVRLVTSCR
ncbi:uncharacterized protein TM35_000222160 [Trypanosoma theileri]|uniref:Uncharacterized protein n=1 Tax=Trypanosoma theileri TaxID=67003 RepID=A0A1X0NRV6_9TRYP|nr:uncharacterized protein TM35_000222160 [Trypanosoma theileri]ORC87417.1 hypothetical protein TM35_000222160 [Trypanosoma theileri]